MTITLMNLIFSGTPLQKKIFLKGVLINMFKAMPKKEVLPMLMTSF